MIIRSFAEQHDAGDADHVAAAHRFADHRERLLAHLIVGREVVIVVEIKPIDLRLGHERLDVDRVARFDLHVGEFVVRDDDVIALGGPRSP